ncbi:MAG TPA: biotin/lipoyl-binding protein, partial [Phycisphaerae bacterium]|nr:biotin/lipoyl-binding protein [Phycisphaerae bacterium]
MASNGNGANGRQTRRRRRWIWPVATALLAAGILFALKAALRSDHRIDPAKLAAVTRGDIARSVVATGVIEPRSKVDIKSKASGIVQRILVDYGDWVRQGQVLAELDKEELKARLREANATLLAAQAAEESAKASHERN